MQTEANTAESNRRWSGPPRFVMPTVILVLFAGLSVLAFLRAGEGLKERFEEQYSTTARVFNKHLELHLKRHPESTSAIQEEVDAESSHSGKIQNLRVIMLDEEDSPNVKASLHPQEGGLVLSEIEKEALAADKTALGWNKNTADFILNIVVPLHDSDGNQLGLTSWAVLTTPTQQDEESMLFGVGFVLLMLAMALYYFREFRRMEKYYGEKDRTTVELRRLSATVNQSANMVVVTDVEGVIEYVNPKFTEVTGYGALEAIGQQSNLLRSGTHDKEFYANLWKTILSKQTWTGKMRNRRKNGELFWERKTISPVLDDRGIIQNYISVGEDITSELRTQQQIIEKDKMSAVGMLAAGVAHEFKNYLGGIMGNASLALEEIDEPDGLESAREALELVVDLSEKANKVAMSLLTYSRSRPEVVGAEDIKTIIQQSLNLVSKEMTNWAIQIATYFEEVPKLNVSASKIQQLLMNLLINAAHAVKEDGVITIALFNAENSVKIVVGDSGSGILPEDLNRVFDPFFSSKGVWGKDDVVGTGMGLPICRNIVREYGGDLTVESVPGIGTAFTIILPVDRTAPGLDTLELNEAHNLRFLIFSVDKSLVSRLHGEASAAGVKLLLVDNIAVIPEDLRDAADLVICDARFPGKGELLRMVEAAERMGIPFATMYCDRLEHPIGEMRDRSIMISDKLPSIPDLVRAMDSHAGRTRLQTGDYTTSPSPTA